MKNSDRIYNQAGLPLVHSIAYSVILHKQTHSKSMLVINIAAGNEAGGFGSQWFQLVN